MTQMKHKHVVFVMCCSIQMENKQNDVTLANIGSLRLVKRQVKDMNDREKAEFLISEKETMLFLSVPKHQVMRI